MMLLVLSLMVSLAHCHFNYNQIAAGSHQASDPSSYYNNQPIRKPMYHYYPMTFFSQSPYSYQTTNKPYYATPSSPSAVAQSPNNNNPPRITPFWYRQPVSKHFHHPGINFEDEFFGPPPSSSVAQDRSLYNPELISPVVPPVEPVIQQVENLDPSVMEVTDSTHLIKVDEASGDGIIQSTIDVTVEVSTESDIQDATTSSLDDEGLSPRSTTSVIEDVTITPEETITEIEDESTTVLNDITTISETESPIIAERFQSIIPFYLKPSTWRS